MKGLLQALVSFVTGGKRPAEPSSAEVIERLRNVESETERRLVPRHASSLPASLMFGFSGIPEPVLIQDLSERGFYVNTGHDMSVGANFDVTLVLPPEMGPGGGPRRVLFHAAVVWIKPGNDGTFGVGAVIKRCDVLPQDPVPPPQGQMDKSAADVQPKPPRSRYELAWAEI
ncbi:MAG TPA: hypothetical protein VGQ71_00165 [Terriglobales bacterium]|nr:hypothetical protein [Terriglobales bacterium]